MSWFIRHRITDKRGLTTREFGDYPTKADGERWLAHNVEGSTRGYEVVERRVGE